MASDQHLLFWSVFKISAGSEIDAGSEIEAGSEIDAQFLITGT